MKRRITAALVALLLMLPGLPVNASEPEVYPIGYKDMWVVGIETVPTAPTVPGGIWDRVFLEDGTTMDTRPGSCPLVEHVDVISCYDIDGNKICGKDEHVHDMQCSVYATIHYTEYRWQVIDSQAEPEPTDPPTTDPPTTDPPATDPSTTDPPDGSASLYIRNVDSDGVPLNGSMFILFEEVPVLDAEGNPVLDENGKPKTEAIGRAEATAVRGIAPLEGLTLEEGTDRATWTLVQNALTGELGNCYLTNGNKWNVTIVRNADGTHTLENVNVSGAETTDHAPNYDPTTHTLTVVNDHLLGNILINVVFEGFEGTVPETVKSTVTVKGPENYQKAIDFPVSHVGFYLQQSKLEGVGMGTYTIAVTDPIPVAEMKADPPVVKVQCPVDADPVEENEVTLSGSQSSALVTITYHYEPVVPDGSTPPETTEPPKATESPKTTEPTTEPTEASNSGSNTGSNTASSQSNTIIVKVVDDQNNPLENTKVGLFSKKGLVREWDVSYENVFILDDLEDLVGAGESASYTLKQTKSPAGYHLSDDSFTVTINNVSGQTSVSIKKDSSGLNLFQTGSGVETGSDGKQIATIVNQRKTTRIVITSEVLVNFAEGTWRDDALVKEYQEQKYEFILTWEDADGEQQEETLVLTGGTSEMLEAELPMGTNYKVSLAQEDAPFLTTFSENAEGTVDVDQLAGSIEIKATQVYTISPGEPLNLSLVKVDADTKRPLAGVTFSLKNEEGVELMTYTSDETGAMEIEGMLNAPGTYTLEEVQTLEEYELLSEPVTIHVTTHYGTEGETNEGTEPPKDVEGDTPVVVQALTATLTSDAVVQESDGSYWIENVLLGEKESGGLGLGAILGIGAAAAAGLGGAAVLILRKRRKTR